MEKSTEILNYYLNESYNKILNLINYYQNNEIEYFNALNEYNNKINLLINKNNETNKKLSIQFNNEIYIEEIGKHINMFNILQRKKKLYEEKIRKKDEILINCLENNLILKKEKLKSRKEDKLSITNDLISIINCDNNQLINNDNITIINDNNENENCMINNDNITILYNNKKLSYSNYQSFDYNCEIDNNIEIDNEYDPLYLTETLFLNETLRSILDDSDYESTTPLDQISPIESYSSPDENISKIPSIRKSSNILKPINTNESKIKIYNKNNKIENKKENSNSNINTSTINQKSKIPVLHTKITLKTIR